MTYPVTLLLILLGINNFAVALNCTKKELHEVEEDEFVEFCAHLSRLEDITFSSTSGAEDEANQKLCEEEIFDPDNLRMLFVLMLMFAYGAFIRTIIQMFELRIPYTVLLMLSGLLIGSLSRLESLCEYMHTFTAIARIPPKIILFTFLPVLIFESAFSITPHTFMRSLVQIIIVAFVGMMISTFMTALVVQSFFKLYNWDFLTASLFGSIISATDPVAVVAILRELGAPEMLTIMIEGESLLNDGVAILLYEIIEQILTCEVEMDDVALFIVQKFCQITLGGPVFGFVMAKIAVWSLSLIFNDAAVEITITLVAAYLTYYIGEDILNVSGVMAVVVLGITMGSERTSISPEVENFVHHFWEMLAYFANTVLFMIVGIVITETALIRIVTEDFIYLFVLYVILNIVRFLMLLMMFPFISRIGYGMSWQNMIVMMWGGLRGAIGICLSLDVYNNEILCQESFIGPKFLFHTAGIVFLTVVLNGTTTRMLLKYLKLSEISPGRVQDMTNAIKQLELAQFRTIGMLKHDRFLSSADWIRVDKYTTIKNPYSQIVKPNRVVRRALSLVSVRVGIDDHHTECPDCHGIVKNDPTVQEYMDMTEEGRFRILKALKISFWRQFENGILGHQAVLHLVDVASEAEDKQFQLVEAHDLRKFWHLKGCLPWMKTKFAKAFGMESDNFPRRPRNCFRRGMWWLATQPWFEGVIILFILLQMIPAIWEIVYMFNDENNEEYEHVFLGLSVFFNFVYVTEALIKIVGRGPHDYFCEHKLNWIDIVVIFLGLMEIVWYMVKVDEKSVFVFVKVFRVARAVRLLKPLVLVPRFMPLLDKRIQTRLFLGYDIGKGFITAVDDVIKFLPQMVDHPKVLYKLKRALLRERLDTVREMGIMQKEHPGVAIAVKTRHTSRVVLNQMRENLLELKADGLVDEMECELLMAKLEENMKRLWKSPPSIPPAPSERLLENISWMGNREKIFNFFRANVQLLTFSYNEIICRADDKPTGIYIITAGMVKINYVPTEEVLSNFENEGEIPCMELIRDLSFRNKDSDFFSTGTVIGEKSVLTNQRRAATVKCETSVFAYHISMPVMLDALKKFNEEYGSLESSMWRAVGIRLAISVFTKHPLYSSWSIDKIRLYVEKSCVPISEQFDTITVHDYISEILVIQGRVKNSFNEKVYFAPQLVPKGVSEINLIHTSNLKARVLIILFEEALLENESDDEDSSQFRSLLALTKASCRLEVLQNESRKSKSVQRRKSKSSKPPKQNVTKKASKKINEASKDKLRSEMGSISSQSSQDGPEKKKPPKKNKSKTKSKK